MNYIHESDSSILVLLQTRMIKCGKVSGEARQIVYTTKHCEFARHRIHFRFRIQNPTKSAPFQLGFTRCISPYTDVALCFFSFFSKNLLPLPLPPCAGGQQIPRGFSFFITRTRRTSKRK